MQSGVSNYWRGWKEEPLHSMLLPQICKRDEYVREVPLVVIVQSQSGRRAHSSFAQELRLGCPLLGCMDDRATSAAVGGMALVLA